jgi:hypothetical protein
MTLNKRFNKVKGKPLEGQLMRAWGRKMCKSIKFAPYYGLLEAMGKEANW